MRDEQKFGSRTEDQFNVAPQSFFEGCKRVSDDYVTKNYPTLTPAGFEPRRLQKRARVMRGGSARCFVDYATGDVLKPAGWKAPAKHARGDIYDEHGGLSWMSPRGPGSLR